MPPLPKVSLVVAAWLALWGAGCEEPCRFDADCAATAGLTRCDTETGQCGPLTPAAPAACDDTADCVAGRVCVGGACHFAPSCQRVVEGATFDYIARCGAETAQGSATASTNGCRVELTLSSLFGADTRVVLDPISSVEGGDAEITTSADGEITCLAGTWSAPASAGTLPACQLPGGRTCEVGLVRTSEGPVCFADGEGCALTATCEPLVGEGAGAVGGCR